MINLPLTPFDVVLRIGAALVAGFIIGLERESRGRAAGLRTYTLTCCASAIAMLIAHFFFTDTATVIPNLGWRPDPNRMAQGILAGMGFLGAGTILRRGNVIRGLTTAAGLWFVTIIGMAFGSGYFLLGGLGLLVALVTLFVLPLLERHVSSDSYASLVLTMSMDSASPEDIKRDIHAFQIQITRAELAYDLAQNQKTIRYEVQFKHKPVVTLSERVLDQLMRHKGVLQVRWEQLTAGTDE
jgi:putative Mg2+ transporter-C (MgtC) family protein